MSTEIETNPEVIRLTAMLARWDRVFPDDDGNLPIDPDRHGVERYKPHMRDVLKRRIFAAINEIEFTNPFKTIDGVDMETLYLCSKPAPPVRGSANDPNRFYDLV